MSQVINVNEGDLSDSKSIASPEAAFNINKEANLFDLATDADQNQLQQKKNKKTRQINAAKYAKLSNKIFDYIHVAQY